MSSAAKLRKFGRGTATIATAALVMTSFGPAAFAWDGAIDNSNADGIASIGLVDTDSATPQTQGAKAVVPGGTGQPIGDVRFVLPETWSAGDYVDFTIGAANPGTAADRTTFSAMPTVSIDSTAYAADTHVNPTSPTTSIAAGATEGGVLKKYVPTGSQPPAQAPQYSVALRASGGDAYNNVLRVTFTNNADNAAPAKFIGTIKSTVDVGTAVNGEITLTAASSSSEALSFADTAGAKANVTVPAAVNGASLSVEKGGVTADGSEQFVGPITVQAAPGNDLKDATAPVTVTLSAPAGSGFVVGTTAVANAYDSTGKLLGTLTNVATTGTTVSVPAADVPAGTTKIVFSNILIDAGMTAGPISYSLTAAGGAPMASAILGGGAAPTNQTDITAPPNSVGATVSASALPDRLGGLDRYQTAVKIAERSLAEQGGGPSTGESDNVIVASGESFPDALSSGYLAATKNAQLILTRQGSLPQADIEFLKNYGAKNIFIVGGEGAVGSAVEDQLRGLQSYDVQARDTNATGGPWTDQTAAGDNRKVVPLDAKLTVIRLAGADRFATNRRVNEYAGATSINPVGVTVPKYGEATKKTAIVANGFTPWDALSAGPLVGNSAGRAPLPVVLTGAGELNANAKTQMQTLDIEAAIMVGGSGVLNDNLMGDLDRLGVYSTRLAGQDRWGTAKAVAEFALRSSAGSSSNQYPGLGFGTHHPILANGGSMNGSYTANGAPNAWADALASGPFAAQTRKVIALTDSRSVPGTTKDMLATNKAKFLVSVIAVGLGDVVSTETVKQANNAISG